MDDISEETPEKVEGVNGEDEHGEGEDEEDEAEEEDKSETYEGATRKGSGEESDDKSFTHSQSQSISYRPSVRTSKSRRFYAQILLDIIKQKRRRSKLATVKEERRNIARSHLERAIEGTHIIVPDDRECLFDASQTGLGGSRITDNYKIPLVPKELSLTQSPSTRWDTETSWKSSKLHLPPLPGIPSKNVSRPGSSDNAVRQKRRGSTDTNSMISHHSAHVVDEHPARTLRFLSPCYPKHPADDLEEEPINWFGDRLALATLPVRYEIPMNVRDFRGMDIKTYLQKYCKIPKDRMRAYEKIYKRYKSAKTQQMAWVELSRAIQNVLEFSVTEVSVAKFLRYLQFDKPGEVIDAKTFSAVAATAERILYLSCAEMCGRPVPPGVVRSFLEAADFDNLKWKLDGIPIAPRLRALLFSLG